MKNTFLILFMFICSISNSQSDPRKPLPTSETRPLNVKGSFSQVNLEWFKVIDEFSNGSSLGELFKISSHGNIFVIVDQADDNYYEQFLIKYNAFGSELWKRKISSIQNIKYYPADVCLDTNENVYVVSNKSGHNYLTKFDDTGEEKWSVKSNTWIEKILIVKNEDIYLSGTNLTKFSKSGEKLWSKPLSFAYTQKIAADKNGCVYILGESIQEGKNTNLITVKFDSVGTEKWRSVYDGPNIHYGWDRPIGLVVDYYCNVYVAGESSGVNTNWDYVLVKYDSTGFESWVQRYEGIASNGSDGQDVVSDIALDSKYNIYLTGETGNKETHYDFGTIKYSPTGVQQWVKFYHDKENTDYEWAKSICVDNFDDIYVVGESIPDTVSYKIIVVKYDNLGKIKWVKKYEDGNKNIPTVAKMDKFGNIYIHGYRYRQGKYCPFIMKYSQK